MPLAPLLDRRRLIAGLTLGCTQLSHSRLAKAQASNGPAPAARSTMLIAGPVGGRLDRWADVLAGPIGRALPGRVPLQRQNVGGLDGVTGANQFEALNEPDGISSMLVPGAAALPWLVGETRAKFDPARWMPLWAATTSAVLVSRVSLAPNRPLRLAAATPAGIECPAFLALDLMGIAAVPSPPQTAEAMLLQGANLRSALAAAAAKGFQPVLTFGVPGTGDPARDPLLPTVPTAFEQIRGHAPTEMIAALRATASAVQLDASLVLPQLTPAAAVALWRRACLPLPQDPEIASEAARRGTRPIDAQTAAALIRQIAGDPTILLTIRHWLATRYEWHPS